MKINPSYFWWFQNHSLESEKKDMNRDFDTPKIIKDISNTRNRLTTCGFHYEADIWLEDKSFTGWAISSSFHEFETEVK